MVTFKFFIDIILQAAL